MRIPRKLKKRLKKIGAYEEFKLLLNPSLNAMINKLADNDVLCDCCYYNDECRGLSSSPDGPIYPACSDSDDCFDKELVAENYKNG